MSIIMGALGGLGEAVTDIAKSNRKFWDDSELQKQQADLQENKAKALERWKVTFGEERAEAARTAQVKRIDDAMLPLVQEARLAKLNKAYGTPNDGTDMSIKASDASEADLAKFGKLDDSEMMQLRKKAAVSTNDLSIKDALADDARQAGIDAKFSGLETRMEIAKLTNEARNAKTEADRAWHMAAIESKIAKAGNGNTDFDKKIKILTDSGATPKELANFIMERKQPSLEDLAANFLKADTLGQTTPEQAMEKAKALRSLSNSVNSSENPKEAMKPKLPDMPIDKSALKAGTVYQTPRGPAKWNGKVFEAQ